MFIFHLFYLEQEPLITGPIFKSTPKITPFSVLLHFLHHQCFCFQVTVLLALLVLAMRLSMLPWFPRSMWFCHCIAEGGQYPQHWGSASMVLSGCKLHPEEEEGLGNGLKARVDSSFTGPGCLSQVAGCAVDPSHSPSFHSKVILRPCCQALLLGIILSRTERLQGGIDCCLPQSWDETAKKTPS